MGGKASPEIRRKASHDYYVRNREAIRAKRNAEARANPRKKDLTTPPRAGARKAPLRRVVWENHETNELRGLWVSGEASWTPSRLFPAS